VERVDKYIAKHKIGIHIKNKHIFLSILSLSFEERVQRYNIQTKRYKARGREIASEIQRIYKCRERKQKTKVREKEGDR